jgi:diguanylate cyclase (GGDEF)-like protein/PAS domain S-box-containing protein
METSRKLLVSLASGVLGLLLSFMPIPGFAGLHLAIGSVPPLIVAGLFGPWWGALAGLLSAIPYYATPDILAVEALVPVAAGIAVRNGEFVVSSSLLFRLTVGMCLSALSNPTGGWVGTTFSSLTSGLVTGVAADALLAIPQLGQRYGEDCRSRSLASHLRPAFIVIGVTPVLAVGIWSNLVTQLTVLATAGIVSGVAWLAASVAGPRVVRPLLAAVRGEAMPGPNVYTDLSEVAELRNSAEATRADVMARCDDLAQQLADREAAYNELLQLSENLEERLQLRGVEIEQRSYLLSLSQRHYREAVQHATDIIYTLDLEGRFVSINAAGERFFGHDLPFLIGRFWYQTLAPGYETSTELAEGMQGILEELHANGRFETTNVHRAAKGEVRLLRSSFELVRDEEGLPLHIHGIAADITELEGFQREVEELGRRVQALQRQAARRDRELNALLTASRTLNSELEIDQLLQHIIESGAAQIQADSGFVGLLDEGALTLRWYWRSGGSSWIDLQMPRVERGITQIVLKTRQPYVCANAAEDPNTDKDFTRRFSIDTMLVLPIFSQSSELLGALALHNFPLVDAVAEDGDEPSIDPKDLRFLEGLADIAAAAIQQSRLFEQVREQAERDPLTGLFNRRAFNNRFDEELERSSRHSRSFSVVLIDIDYLKKINDTYGHPIGDAAICTVADILQGRLRRHDFAARIGGEEFAVLVVESRAEVAVSVAKSLLEGIRRRDVPRVGHITASLGVSTFPEDASTRDDLIRLADEALYMAKNRGRDRVVHIRQIDTGDLGNPS